MIQNNFQPLGIIIDFSFKEVFVQQYFKMVCLENMSHPLLTHNQKEKEKEKEIVFSVGKKARIFRELLNKSNGLGKYVI